MAQLTICVTVDWEGANLKKKNLEAMTRFRKTFKDVPLTHFICPAYFTRGDGMKPENQNETRQAEIKDQIWPGDEVGLHVHAWESLVRGAAVAPRIGPSWDLDGVGFVVEYPGRTVPPDFGHGVPLGAYAVDEIASILQFGKELLLQYELTKSVKSFRCGGWMASDSVMEALDKIGVRVDSSATDAAFFANARVSSLKERSGLGNWLARLWGGIQVDFPSPLKNSLSLQRIQAGIDSETQPYQIQIPGGGTITEIPDNALLIDYLRGKQMLERLNSAFKRVGQSEENFVLVCGFHQESAADYIGRLTGAMEEFLRGKTAIKFRTVEQVAGPNLID